MAKTDGQRAHHHSLHVSQGKVTLSQHDDFISFSKKVPKMKLTKYLCIFSMTFLFGLFLTRDMIYDNYVYRIFFKQFSVAFYNECTFF